MNTTPCTHSHALHRDVANAVHVPAQARTRRRRPGVQPINAATASIIGELDVSPVPPLPPLPRPLPLSFPSPQVAQQPADTPTPSQPPPPQPAASSPQGEPTSQPSLPQPRPSFVYDLTSIWQAPTPAYSHFTRAITTSTSHTELLATLQMHQGNLNAVNVVAALHRTVTLCRDPLRAFDARLVTSQIVPLLVQELHRVKGNLQPRGIATTLYCLGVLDVRDRDLYTELATMAEGKLAEFTAQGLSNMLWAFARTGVQPSPRWMAVYVAVARAKLGTFSAQDLGMVLWAFAKLKYRLSLGNRDDFLAASVPLLPQAGAQTLSMIAYSLVYQDCHPGKEWLDSFCTCVANAMLQRRPGQVRRRYRPQTLALTMWALARMQHRPSGKVLGALDWHLVREGLDQWKPVDVATLTYALALLRVRVSAELWRTLQHRIRRVLFSMQPNHLANTSLALAYLRVWVANPQQQADGSAGNASEQSAGQHARQTAQRQASQQQASPPQLDLIFLSKLVSVCYSKMGQFNSRDVSMLAQALARLRCQLPATFLTALHRRIEQLGASFQPTDISLTLWALQRLGVGPTPSLMVEFFLATDRRLSSFKPQELSVMIWALSQAQYKPDKEWTEEFLHCTYVRMNQFTNQALANIVCSLANLGVRPTPAWLYLFVKTCTPLLPTASARDLHGLITGLALINDGPDGAQLPRVDGFLTEARTLLNTQLAARHTAQHEGGGAAAAAADDSGEDSDGLTPDAGLSHWMPPAGGLGSLYPTRGGTDKDEEEVLRMHEEMSAWYRAEPEEEHGAPEGGAVPGQQAVVMGSGALSGPGQRKGSASSTHGSTKARRKGGMGLQGAGKVEGAGGNVGHDSNGAGVAEVASQAGSSADNTEDSGQQKRRAQALRRKQKAATVTRLQHAAEAGVVAPRQAQLLAASSAAHAAAAAAVPSHDSGSPQEPHSHQ